MSPPPWNATTFDPSNAKCPAKLSDHVELCVTTRPQGQGLNDLYVRFFRVAERCITERGVQHGIVCYISNYSWLDGLSHTGLRERFLEEFDEIWIDSLNGDKYKTGKTTPDGKPDPSVFSTPHNREGIQVGTAIAMFARYPKHSAPATIHFRDFWGDAKREELLQSLSGTALAAGNRGENVATAPAASAVPLTAAATQVEPIVALGLPFRPMATEANYTTWPLLEELLPISFPGVQTKQDQLVVDIDQARLIQRMHDYFDASVSDSQMSSAHAGSMDGHSSCDAIKTRAVLQSRGIKKDYLVPFLYKAFDKRWIYWEPETNLLGRKSPDLFGSIFVGNLHIEARRKEPIEIWRRGTVTSMLVDNFGNGFSNFFPMLLRPVAAKGDLFAEADTSRQIDGNNANISDVGLQYLQSLNGIADHPHLFHHTIAILHAPSYAAENAPALRQDWPRVPLPVERQRLLDSAELGRQVAALLDPEAKVPGVTSGKIASELKLIGQPTKVGGGNFTDDDYAVTARWGIAGKGGITMPGKGRVVSRPFDAAERTALESVGEPGGVSPRTARAENVRGLTPPGSPNLLAVLGEETCDIFLNEHAHWKNVPRPVWEYTLGGYQVLKKWLSYREQTLLGRPLTVEEVNYFRDVTRRITALLLLGPSLDAKYSATKANTYTWPRA